MNRLFITIYYHYHRKQQFMAEEWKNGWRPCIDLTWRFIISYYTRHMSLVSVALPCDCCSIRLRKSRTDDWWSLNPVHFGVCGAIGNEIIFDIQYIWYIWLGCVSGIFCFLSNRLIRSVRIKWKFKNSKECYYYSQASVCGVWAFNLNANDYCPVSIIHNFVCGALDRMHF